MTSCIPSISSSSLPFPTSSVTFLDLRPLPAPPPDPPPQICFFSSESHSQLPLSTLSSLTRPLQPLPLVDLKSRRTYADSSPWSPVHRVSVEAPCLSYSASSPLRPFLRSQI